MSQRENYISEISLTFMPGRPECPCRPEGQALGHWKTQQPNLRSWKSPATRGLHWQWPLSRPARANEQKYLCLAYLLQIVCTLRNYFSSLRCWSFSTSTWTQQPLHSVHKKKRNFHWMLTDGKSKTQLWSLKAWFSDSNSCGTMWANQLGFLFYSVF